MANESNICAMYHHQHHYQYHDYYDLRLSVFCVQSYVSQAMDCLFEVDRL